MQKTYLCLSVTLNARRPSSPTTDDLNRLLSNSPHLAVYIRTLYYFVNRKEFITNRFSWLSPMFKRLVKLQRLNIIYKTSAQGRNLDWMSSFERLVIIEGHVGPLQQLYDARRPDGKLIIDFSSLKELEIGTNVVRLNSMKELVGMCRNFQWIKISSMSFPHLISSSFLCYSSNGRKLGARSSGPRGV